VLAAAGSGLAGAVLPASAQARTTISTGHVDVVAARIVRARLRLFVRDASGARARWRDPDDVTLRVGAAGRVRLPGGFDIVGRRGSSAWLMPQTQRAGVPWAGWSTEALSPRDVRGSVSWTLRSASGPGRFVLFQASAPGRHSVLFSSAARTPQRRTLGLGAHGHGTWAFTRRGTYRLSFELAATSRHGRALKTTRTLRIRVG
jgi:surface-anchored protein